MHSIAITTECVADLPQNLYDENEIDIIYFDVRTESGVFRDTREIDSQNVIEYMADGKKKAISVVPTANEYKSFFSKKLSEYNEVIHICISDGISVAYSNATLAKVKMGRDGEKVHIIDSRHLSSGQGLLVLAAVKCLRDGMSSEEIVDYIEKMKTRISTSFLANNADYLYYNGKVKSTVMKLCKTFHIHPVLAMIEGKLTLKKVFIGNYNIVAKRYIKYLLGNKEKIKNDIGFLTYAGCSEEILDMVKKNAGDYIAFDDFHEQAASATVSSNCGPKTFGILFVMKE